MKLLFYFIKLCKYTHKYKKNIIFLIIIFSCVFFFYSTAQRRFPLTRRSELARALIVNICVASLQKGPHVAI